MPVLLLLDPPVPVPVHGKLVVIRSPAVPDQPGAAEAQPVATSTMLIARPIAAFLIFLSNMFVPLPDDFAICIKSF